MSSESRIWEIRPFGSMRGGKELVIGLCAFQSSLSRLLYRLNSPVNNDDIKVKGLDFDHFWAEHLQLCRRFSGERLERYRDIFEKYLAGTIECFL